MATTTPNFGWAVPTSTDLVKDGAVAIETLGDAIDASLLDLKGGTTGQVLSKTSNTDMDFTWVAQDDSNAIQNAIVDAKGDIIAATANDTPARLAVGTANQVLTVDSTTATGLKWATPSGGTFAWTSFTPTWANLTVGNGTVTAFQITIGNLYTYYINLVFGSTTSVAGHIKIPNPVTSAGYATIASPISKVICYDSSAAKQYEAYGETGDSGTRNNLLISDVSGTYPDATVVNATQPFTWAVNDELRVIAQYRIA